MYYKVDTIFTSFLPLINNWNKQAFSTSFECWMLELFYMQLAYINIYGAISLRLDYWKFHISSLRKYLFLEKHVRFSIINRRNIRKEKNKKAMKKAREANKNSGAEPEESKIPGINC